MSSIARRRHTSSSSSPSFAILSLVVALAGCSFADDQLWPTLSGGDPKRTADFGRNPAAPSVSTLAATGAGTDAAGTAPRPPQGSAAGLSDQLQRLQADVSKRRDQFTAVRGELQQNAETYDRLLTGIEGSRRSGTPATDPQLGADVNRAQMQIDRVANGIAQLSNLSSWATSDATLANYILQATRAASMQPDLGDSERRQIIATENETNRTATGIDRLLSDIGEAIATAGRRLGADRQRLAAVTGGSAVAASPAAGGGATRSPAAATTRSTAAAAAAARPDERRPLVVIHFDRPDVAYRDDLNAAVTAARQRRPDIGFDVVGVSPPGRPPESLRRNVDSVVRSLADMGVAGDRIRPSATTRADVQDEEVRLYVR